MFSKIIVIICLFFFVADGAKYRVLDQNLRKLSKEQKIEAIKKVKAHIQSFNSNDVNVRTRKELEGIKKLKSWNDYDAAFDSTFWMNSEMYESTDCSGGAILQQSEYSSFCYTGTFEGGAATYFSARSLFKSDCSEKTIAFYTSNDCTGTPAQQGNSQLLTIPTTCLPTTSDDDDGLPISSATVTCTASASSWTGGDSVQFKNYEQTTTCSPDGLLFSIVNIKGGCYPNGDGSIEYSSGPTFSEYTTQDCTGDAEKFSPASCEDDDGDDDDDNEFIDDAMFDDAMFTEGTDVNTNTSTAYAWNASSMGAVLNYSLSAALVLVSCTLFF